MYYTTRLTLSRKSGKVYPFNRHTKTNDTQNMISLRTITSVKKEVATETIADAVAEIRDGRDDDSFERDDIGPNP